MIRNGLLVFLLVICSICSAQRTQKKTAVFKVRAPLASCSIICNEPFFLLEKESSVVIKIKGRNPKIKVSVKGGKIISENGNTYKIRFLTAGTAVISVHQVTEHGSKLIGIKKNEVRSPQLFFCGLATDSSSKMLRLGPVSHLYAYSTYFKKNLPVNKFDMLFYEDILINERKKEKIDTLRSDTCFLTKEMKNKLNQFQPKINKMYFYNLVCKLPDGTIRVLEPVELLGAPDTAMSSAFHPSCIFTLKKKKV